MRVEIAKETLKIYERINKPDRSRIKEDILSLSHIPHPPPSTRLVGSDFFRIRRGNWRIIYYIDKENDKVLVTKITGRNEKTYTQFD